jgi:hypothetical protein
MASLSIANSYGNVDVRASLSKAYKHVRGPRLQPLCRKLGIKFAPAVVAFQQSGSHLKPVFDGVVISTRSEAKLREAIRAREQRAQSPAATARKERRAAEKRKAEREVLRQERQHEKRCRRLGIHPEGRIAELLAGGHIDEDLAELLGFTTRYRHEHTDYDQHFDDDQYHDLRSLGFTWQEAKEELRATAREAMQHDPIPSNWPEFLRTYKFTSAIAKALADTLRSPKACYPAWFKEAEIAVRRAGLSLEALSYGAITQAIAQWRAQRRRA